MGLHCAQDEKRPAHVFGARLELQAIHQALGLFEFLFVERFKCHVERDNLCVQYGDVADIAPNAKQDRQQRQTDRTQQGRAQFERLDPLAPSFGCSGLIASDLG
jgi:hypothetical protein